MTTTWRTSWSPSAIADLQRFPHRQPKVIAGPRLSDDCDAPDVWKNYAGRMMAFGSHKFTLKAKKKRSCSMNGQGVMF